MNDKPIDRYRANGTCRLLPSLLSMATPKPATVRSGGVRVAAIVKP